MYVNSLKYSLIYIAIKCVNSVNSILIILMNV